uniref:zinc finger matrin-type protein 4 isoform X3 n=1 Tax=Myxine glutinosa TaxID=7769 RepID=UPI00358E4502
MADTPVQDPMSIEEVEGETKPIETKAIVTPEGDLYTDTQCKVCNAQLNFESQRVAHYQSRKHANKVRLHEMMNSDEGPTIPKLPSMTSANEELADGESRYKYCKLCCMMFSSPVVAQQHYQGKVHAKRLQMNVEIAAVKTDGSSALMSKNDSMMTLASSDPQTPKMSATDVLNSNKFCTLCNAVFNSPAMASNHYVGKKHMKNVTRTQTTTSGDGVKETTKPVLTTKGDVADGGRRICETCNIILNSPEQFQMHEKGAKHQAKLKSKQRQGQTQAF